MTREEIEKRMDDAARKYAETHDEKYKEEVWELARQLDIFEGHLCCSPTSGNIWPKPALSLCHPLFTSGSHRRTRRPRWCGADMSENELQDVIQSVTHKFPLGKPLENLIRQRWQPISK